MEEEPVPLLPVQADDDGRNVGFDSLADGSGASVEDVFDLLEEDDEELSELS